MKPPRQPRRGFVYVAMLFALAIFGLGLAKLGQWTSEQERRDREAELLRTGEQVIAAIRQYYIRSPGTAQRFPKTFADLTEDTRYIGTVRYLRAAPLDPITLSSQWGYVRTADGGFSGIFSLSNAVPLTQRPIEMARTLLPVADRYSQWRFAYDPATEPTAAQR
jgi:type II secretory pathway pseudopilin PulG